MSQKKDLRQMELSQTLFAADSLARTYQRQNQRTTSAQKEKDLTGRDLDYGVNTKELLATYDLNSQSWRTSQLCFMEIEADGFSEFLGGWPRSGMTANGIAYQLPTLAHLIKGIESGLLPTPTKHNSKEGAYPAEYTRNTQTLAVHAGGRINPAWTEWLMGLPHKWSDLEVSETDKYQQWLQQHGDF